MKVGDLVIQIHWEADGAGIITKVRQWIGGTGFATVLWPDGVVDMEWSQLKVINESR